MLENTEIRAGLCSRLLTEELQLIRTYAEAIGRFEGSPYESLIVLIHANHEKNAGDLRVFVNYSGKAFSDLIPASRVGRRSLENPVDLPALEKLVEGEKHAMTEYEAALVDPHISEELRTCISGKLILRLQEHVVVLRLIRSSVPEFR
ncbi:MAG: hypothetical protein V4689_10950 [Verrucomicrobiota bacterium]